MFKNKPTKLKISRKWNVWENKPDNQVNQVTMKISFKNVKVPGFIFVI